MPVLEPCFPSVMVCGGAAFGRWLGLDGVLGQSPLEGLVSLREILTALCSPPCEETAENLEARKQALSGHLLPPGSGTSSLREK